MSGSHTTFRTSLSGFCSVGGGLVALLYTSRQGRRRSLTVGYFLSTCSWLGAATATYLARSTSAAFESAPPYYSVSFFCRLLSTLCVCSLTVSLSAALAPVTWMWPAEVFPIWARGKASSLACASHGICALVAYYGLVHSKGDSCDEVRLLSFAMVSAVLGYVFYSTVPETEGVIKAFMP